MTRAVPSVLLALAALGCRPSRTAHPPIEQVPIGVVGAAPLAAETEEIARGPGTAPSESEEPNPACAVPTQCPVPETMGTFSITLERTACFGRCPTYRVTIDSRGNVTWEGREWVDVPGTTEVLGDPKEARELAELVVGSCFFDMKDEYSAPVTDQAWAITTVSVGNRTKTIRHYLGEPAGESARTDGVCSAPTVLTKIEEKIDEVANTARWVGTGGRARNGVVSPS